MVLEGVGEPLVLKEPANTPERMEAVARDRVAYVRREHPTLPCGGKLLLAELTRDSLSVRTIADLESAPAASAGPVAIA